MTYDEAERLFSTSRSGSKFLGERSTWLEKDGNDFVIRYHATHVVRIHRNGLYTLNSGGYHTMTTKKRINKYSPAHIFQRDFQWFIDNGVEFFDGVHINSSGGVVNLPKSIERRM